MKCMVCKNDFESLVEFAGKTVCEGCYDRPSMVVVKLIESYLKADDLEVKDKLYSQLNEYSSALLFMAACILSECGFCVCDIVGKILSKRGDNAYNVFVNIIETDLFKRFGYWMCNSNMSDESKYKLGLLYNNALRQEAMDNDNYIEFLFGVNTW